MEIAKLLRKPAALGKQLLKWALLVLLLGLFGGLLGSGLHYVLYEVMNLRSHHRWLVYLLPLGGLAFVGIYQLLGRRALACLPATALTHLLGGSAGREEAALQLGDTLARLLARPFRLEASAQKTLAAASMSAVLSGLLGMPLTSAALCMKLASPGALLFPALLPCLLAALAASRVSGLLGIQADGFLLDTAFSLSPSALGRYLLLAVLVGLLDILVSGLFRAATDRFHGKNPYLRSLLGGLVLAGLTAWVGDHRFNGTGMHLALQAVAGETPQYAFALKLLFTAVTLAAGFQGGRLAPTLCIGAAFGCLAGGLLGLPPGFAAALGLAGLFCCTSGSVVAAVLLSFEMFSGANLPIFVFVCVICFALSGPSSLYRTLSFHS